MSLAKKCDLCGALFEYEKKRDNSIGIGQRNVSNEMVDRRWYDCCPKCFDVINGAFASLKEGDVKND